MAENINIDFMPNRKTADTQRVGAVEDYLRLFTDRAKFCFSSIYDELSDIGKRLDSLDDFTISTPSSVDLVVENAVILQEKESQQVIHNFTKTHYVDDNNIGYGSDVNDIICNGYIIAKENHENSSIYQSMTFNAMKKLSNTEVWTDFCIYARLDSVADSGSRTWRFGYSYVDSGGVSHTVTLRTSTYSSTEIGIWATWDSIYASTEEFPYGCADIAFREAWLKEDGTVGHPLSNSVLVQGNVAFSSEAEYNAAVGLTNTPIELIELKDFQYLVPESQIIVDKELSEGSDNVIANSTVAKALSLKADKETVETLSLVVDSKADIIELDALSQKVEGKAEKSEVQSIAQAVEGKAESSDLMAHTGNTDNPHGVTKAQIGLSKVENKSSADILSELEIGGRNYISNSAFLNGSTGWTLDAGVTVDTETLFVTHPTLKIDQSGFTTDEFGGATTVRLPEINSFAVKSGETVIISFWYYLPTLEGFDSANLNMAFGGTKEGTTTSGNITIFRVARESLVVGQWTRIIVPLTFANNYTKCYINTYINRNGLIWLADFKLERGNSVTDWTPAPEDVMFEIDGGVNNVKIGGRNLVRNSNAERTWNTNTANRQYVSSLYPYSDYAKQTLHSGAVKQITVSYDYETTFPSCKMSIQSGYNVWSSFGTVDITEANQSGHVEYVYTVPSSWLDCGNTGVRILITQYDDIYEMKISNFKLEIGNKSTDWTPAPEDAETRVTSLEERVATLEAILTAENN